MVSVEKNLQMYGVACHFAMFHSSIQQQQSLLLSTNLTCLLLKGKMFYAALSL